MDTIQIVATSIGVVLITVILFLTFSRERLTVEQFLVLRILISLACACVAVTLTGFLTVDMDLNSKVSINAGGALAVWVVVYFFNPASYKISVELPNDMHEEWRAMHDLHVDVNKANQEDIARAINAVNRTAKRVSKHRELRKTFKDLYSEEYCSLHKKLLENKYPVEHKNTSSDLLLTDDAKALAKEIC